MVVCSLTHTLPAVLLVVNNKAVNSLKKSDRFMLGCKAAAGIPVSEISKETQVSCTYIYQQKANVQNYIETLDKTEEPVPSINIDKDFIKRMYGLKPVPGLPCIHGRHPEDFCLCLRSASVLWKDQFYPCGSIATRRTV